MFVAIYICILPTILTLPGINRLSRTTAGYSADHAATKPRIETYCTDTKDQADTSAQFKKCFRKLTSLQTGAAFSLLPSRLRCLEEKRFRKRNEIRDRGRERGVYRQTPPNFKQICSTERKLVSVPTRPPANPQSTSVVYSIQAPVLNGDRGSV